MAFSVSYIYEIIDRYSAPLRKIQNQTRQYNNTVKKTNFNLGILSKKLRSIGGDVKSFGQSMTMGVSLLGAGFAGMALVASANMETMKVQFEVMLDSADKAKQMIADLTQYSKDTPFELPGVTKAAKVMLGYGFQQKEVMTDMKMLGDISAGSGKNLAELAVIYGQVKNAGRLMGQESLQFVNASVPLNKELAKIISEKLGISIKKATPLIRKLGEQGKISFEMVKQALFNMRKEGGVFFNMTDRLAMTLAGKWAKVTENFSLFMIDVGDLIVKVAGLKGGLDDLNVVLESAGAKFKAWTEANPVLAKMALILASVLIVMGPLLIVIGFIAQGIGALMSVSLPVVGVIAAIVVGVGLLVAAFQHWFKSSHPVAGILKTLWEATKRLFSSFWKLGSALGNIIRKFFGIKEEASLLNGVFDRLGWILMPIIDTFSLFVTGLGTGLTFIADLVNGDVNSAFKNLNDSGRWLEENFKGLYDTVGAVFVAIWEHMDRVDRIVAAIAKKLDPTIQKLKEVVGIFQGKSLTEGYGDYVKSLPDLIFGGPTTTDTGKQNAKAAAVKSNLNTTINTQGVIKVVSDDKTNIVDAIIKLNEGDNLAASY